MRPPKDWEFDYVSASQLKKYLRCDRLWFLEYPLDRKQPPSDAMKYGIDRHNDLEAYLDGDKDELEFLETEIIQEKGFVPDRDRALPEVRYEREIVDGVNMVGYMDCVHVDEQSRPVITDWKFRSSIGSPTRMSLRENVQLLCYAWAFPGLTGLTWDSSEFVIRLVESLKVHKGGPAVEETRAVVSQEYVNEFIEDFVQPKVRRMAMDAGKEFPELPGDQSETECFRYGPCSHKDFCWSVDYNPRTDGDSSPEDDDMSGTSVKDLLGNRHGDGSDDSEKSGQTEQTEESKEAEGVTPPDQEPDREPKDLDEIRIDEYGWSDGRIAGVGDATEENILAELQEEGYETLSEVVEANFDFSTVKGIGKKTANKIQDAIEAEVPFEPEEPEQNREIRELTAKIQQAKDLLDEIEWDASLISEGEIRRCENAEQVANMMRQKVDKNSSSSTDKDTTSESSTDDEDTVEDSASSSESGEDDRMILCINCTPLHNTHEFDKLYKLLEPLKEELADELGVPHWNAADYREGQQLMGKKVMEHIGEFEGRKIMCCNDQIPGSKEALEWLLPRADEVYKG